MTRPGGRVFLAAALAVAISGAVFDAARLSAAGDRLSEAMGRLKVSRPLISEMPVFTLRTLDGTPVRSADFAGKVVLLNFWATWCGPCKEEMPALDRLRRRFAGKDVVLLTVTTDHQREGIQAFLQGLGLGLPVLLDEDKDVSDRFMVRGLPTTVVIGKDGQVAGRAVGPREWDGPEAVALVQALTEVER